jgi:hypothetical protein
MLYPSPGQYQMDCVYSLQGEWSLMEPSLGQQEGFLSSCDETYCSPEKRCLHPLTQTGFHFVTPPPSLEKKGGQLPFNISNLVCMAKSEETEKYGCIMGPRDKNYCAG